MPTVFHSEMNSADPLNLRKELASFGHEVLASSHSAHSWSPKRRSTEREVWHAFFLLMKLEGVIADPADAAVLAGTSRVRAEETIEEK
jgi:threonine synthase